MLKRYVKELQKLNEMLKSEDFSQQIIKLKEELEKTNEMIKENEKLVKTFGGETAKEYMKMDNEVAQIQNTYIKLAIRELGDIEIKLRSNTFQNNEIIDDIKKLTKTKK